MQLNSPVVWTMCGRDGQLTVFLLLARDILSLQPSVVPLAVFLSCLPSWGKKKIFSFTVIFSWGTQVFRTLVACSSSHRSVLTLPSCSSIHVFVIGLFFLFHGLICLSPPPSCVFMWFMCAQSLDVQSCLCTCMQKPEVNFGQLLISPSPQFLSQDSLLNLQLTDWLAIQQIPGILVLSVHRCTQFFPGS